MIFLLLRKPNREHLLHRPRDQLLLGLCFLDVCGSFAHSFSTTPGPAVLFLGPGDSDYPKYGNIQTCTAQGFLSQLGFGVPLYNAALCIYHVLTVRFKVTDATIMRWLIPPVHFVNLGFIFSTASVALRMGLFNTAGVLGCWIHGTAGFCIERGLFCDRRQDADQFELYFLAIHLALSFVIVVISMFVLYRTVRKIEQRSRRWQSRWSIATQAARVQSIGLPLTRRTAETGILYSTTFLLVYVPLGLLGLKFFEHSSPAHRIVTVLVALLTPLQGFFNMLIFTSDIWISWLHRHGVSGQQAFSAVASSVQRLSGLLSKSFVVQGSERHGMVDNETELENEADEDKKEMPHNSLRDEDGRLEQEAQRLEVDLTASTEFILSHRPSLVGNSKRASSALSQSILFELNEIFDIEEYNEAVADAGRADLKGKQNNNMDLSNEDIIGISQNLPKDGDLKNKSGHKASDNEMNNQSFFHGKIDPEVGLHQEESSRDMEPSLDWPDVHSVTRKLEEEVPTLNPLFVCNRDIQQMDPVLSNQMIDPGYHEADEYVDFDDNIKIWPNLGTTPADQQTSANFALDHHSAET